MSSAPVLKKTSAKTKEKLRKIFSRKARHSSVNSVALPGTAAPCLENGRSHTPSEAYSPSHTSEASPHPSSDPELNTPDKFKMGLSIGWNALETALRLLERSVDAFPPLRSTVGGLLALLDLGEAVIENNEEYTKLTIELTNIAETLARHAPALATEGVSSSIVYIVESINTELAQIKQQRDRKKIMRTITAIQDQGDVIQRYRRIKSLFRQLQSDITLRTWDGVRKLTEAGLLKDMSPVYEAIYNSDYSTTIKRGRCTAKTREEVLEALKFWVGDPAGAKIYWMNGMAGTGKTTISYTLCEWLKNNNQLGANYFSSRASDLCRNVNRIVPTLAHQLAQYSYSFRSSLCKALDQEPGACRLAVTSQFEKLTQRPLEAIETAIPDNVVIVIDALDECDDSDAFRLFLDTLLQLAVNLPIKFFVTSRPEPAIRDRILASQYSSSVLYLHDIAESIVGADIRKYLTEALSPMSPVPSCGDMEQLVESSGKLFIYAATAVRYICPGDSDVDCKTRLQTVLGTVSGSIEQYDDLNELYTNILHAALYPCNKRRSKDERNSILLVLKMVVCAMEPMTTQTLASLLGLEEKQVRLSLQPLRSVLYIREGLKETIAPFHASFPEFLFNKCRSEDEFHCDQSVHNEILTNHCFDLMKEELRFNICNLESSFVPDEDVPNLPERIKSAISPALSYACRYWGEHFLRGELTDTVHEKLDGFLKNRLLFWMEVLNLEHCIEEGGNILGRIWNQLRDVCLYPDTLKELKDARQFIFPLLEPWESCVPSTPHIYISGLAFDSRTSSVHKNYWGHMKGLIGMQQANNSLIHTYSDSGINSIAFPLTQSGSGSSDEVIRVQDAYNGNLIMGPFHGHTDSIWSIAFSPDATRIVSGSSDLTIRVWDVRNGDMVAGPFLGHTDVVFSVAFSPGGTQIASGSKDCTIRVWDAHSGHMVAGPSQGHTDWVRSVAFSPDGTRIVSGSMDNTIRVWHTYNMNMAAGPFNGHTDDVRSVAFSPDGNRIVSGSLDKTIRVWDAENGTMVAGPFNGHRDSVLSVAFSPNGIQIISGSMDKTIRVWDAQKGNVVAGPFHGHTDWVRSVAFSSNGTQIVSGSMDNTVRVWDAQNGNVVAGPFIGHEGWVFSVAFSPDGKRVVSSSGDHTIRLWDANAGVMDSVSGFGDRALNHSLFSGNVFGNLPVRQYKLRKEGWITADNNLLLWIPGNFHTELLYAGNVLAISSRGVVPAIDFSNTFIGETWSQCYH